MVSLRTKFEIFNLLSNVVTGDGDMCTYVEGWTDSRVASQLGTTKQAVVAVRKALYANFLTPARPTRSRQGEIEKRLERLEQQMEIVLSDVKHLYGQRSTPSAYGVTLGGSGETPRVPRWDEE